MRFKPLSMCRAACSAVLAMLWLPTAAVEINHATVAELDGVRGIGPALSRAMPAERDAAPFQDWPDLMRRVRGVKAATASQLSDAGLTVQGQPFNRSGKAPPSTMRPPRDTH